MRLTFTKGAGKYDELLVQREGRKPQTIACPKQGIIPHDMVHYAVESTLAHGGFLALVAKGQPAAFQTKGGEAEEAIERLVESFQAEMWGGRVSADELLATYVHACATRNHVAIPVAVEDVERIRHSLDELTAKWAAIPVHGSLILELG